MAAKQVLTDGLHRKIGTGAETKVWKDVWLPTNPPRPAIPRDGNTETGLMVHHLIDFERKEWNVNLVQQLVADVDVPLVLSLKISCTGRQDTYTWSHTNSGNYTVRSGHAVAVKQRKQDENAAIVEPNTTELKKNIWKLKCPRKIKHFLWSAVSGFVVSARKLKERHCGNDAVCQRCGTEQETINHIIFECPPAVQCWALSSIPSPPGIFPSSSIYTNMDTLIGLVANASMQDRNVSMFPWLIWYIWKARNEKCFNAKDVTPLDTLQLATSEVGSWRIAQIVETNAEGGKPVEDRRQVIDHRDTDCRWICQVDASWKDKNEGTWLGFILFEDRPMRLLGIKHYDKVASPLHAEAEALSWALKETKKIGASEVIVESDCQQLVRLINKPQEWPALGPELDEIDFLCSEFSFFSVNFINRSFNGRAYCLFKAGRSRAPNFCYLGDKAPPWLVLEASLCEPLVV